MDRFIQFDKAFENATCSRWMAATSPNSRSNDGQGKAKRHLTRYESEGNQFLNCIVAINETWVRSYEPELKSQSTEWHTPDTPRPAKFR